MTVVVRAERVSKRWGEVLALSELSVEIDDGITGLLGANGAGKTTFLGLLLGLHQATEGRLEVLGHDPRRAGPAVRAQLGYSPEDEALPPQSRAQDLVRHVAELHGLPPRAATSRASETLDLVGLGEERLREIGTMSVGQKQRVKLAQAIAHDPGLVLLDEPTNGLDPIQRDEVLTTITRIGRDLGIPVVVSSHLISEVERICDTVVVLDGGRLIGTDRVDQLVRPGDEVIVDVDGDLASLVSALRDAGVEATPVGPTSCTLTLSDPDVLDTIRDALVAAGVGLHALRRRSSSLEERFFPAETAS